jgi:hypothetical protein
VEHGIARSHHQLVRRDAQLAARAPLDGEPSAHTHTHARNHKIKLIIYFLCYL